MDFQTYDTLVFDWDGTLVDTFPFIIRAHNHVRTLFGLPELNETEFLTYARWTAKHSYPIQFGARAEEAMQELYRFIETEKDFSRDVVEMPGARAFLDLIREEGRKAVLVSNKRGAVLRQEVAALGWEDRFSAVVGAGDAPADKPDPAPLFKAIGEADTKKCLYFGDTITDYLCTRTAGMPFVLIAGDEMRKRLFEDLEGDGETTENLIETLVCYATFNDLHQDWISSKTTGQNLF